MPKKKKEGSATCGYTTDGMVFLHTDAVDPDGQVLRATFTWDPGAALKMAQDIANAAGEAAKFYKPKGTKK